MKSGMCCQKIEGDKDLLFGNNNIKLNYYKIITKMLGDDYVDKSKMNSYKRRLKALLFGVCILIGVGIAIECNNYILMTVEERTLSVSSNTQTYTYMEVYQEPTQYIYDENMYEDETYTYQEGESGSKSVTVMSTYENGNILDEKVLDTEIVNPAIPEIICVGTKERPEYIVPVEDYFISSEFGPRWGSTHHGIDFAVCTGTPVVAAREGVIIQTGWNDGLGISVYVEHPDGVVTRYAHLNESIVELGQQVSQGEVIAYSGNTGYSTGPHLHFEVRIDGEAVNPVDFVDVEY